MSNERVRISEKPSLAHLISPQQNQKIPIHGWFQFKHGYSRELTVSLIKSLNLSPGSWVLDSFCGSGTTLLTCKEFGINSRGFDILPFSVFLSNVKIASYDVEVLQHQLSKFTGQIHQPSLTRKGLPNIPLIDKAFRPEVKLELLSLKQKIENIYDLKFKIYCTIYLYTITLFYHLKIKSYLKTFLLF